MDKQTLLIFAKRIFNSGSLNKALLSLNQLKALLEEQGAPRDSIDLLKTMINSAPEMKDAATKPTLTEFDVEVAQRRANERKAREEAARAYGNIGF